LWIFKGLRFTAFCFLPSAFCFLPSVFSEFIVIVVIVERFFLDQIQFHWIQTHDFELNSTLFTIHGLALVYVEINMDISIAFRTRSGRHFYYLQRRIRILELG
jgi:hypothetical protein